MLSLEECRKFLGDEVQVSDEELDRVRADLYGVALAIVEHLAAGVEEAPLGPAAEPAWTPQRPIPIRVPSNSKAG